LQFLLALIFINRYLQHLSNDQQIEFLKTQQEYLKKVLEEIENKIKELSEKKLVNFPSF
jgi:prefoldin subunit 5